MCVKKQLHHICYVEQRVYTCDKPVGCFWTQLEMCFYQIKNELQHLVYVTSSQPDTSKGPQTSLVHVKLKLLHNCISISDVSLELLTCSDLLFYFFIQ